MKLLHKTLRPERLARHLRDRLATAWRIPGRPTVALVGDGARWSIREDQRHLAEHLRSMGFGVRRIRDVTAARGGLVHVLDRGALLKLDPRRVAGGVRLVLTWYHGSPEDPDFEAMYEALRRWLPRVAAVVTSCQITRRDLIRGGVEDAKIVVVPLGVDLDVFGPLDGAGRRAARAAWGVEEGQIAVGSFQKDGAGWGEGQRPKLIKGPDLFLETLDRWRADRPADRIKVLLTGPARGYVQSGLDRRGIAWTHRNLAEPAEMARAYGALDLYVIASRCEGGPKALLECWAAGVPVVGHRVGMVADWLIEGQTGLSVEVGDTAGLAAACGRMVSERDLRERCVSSARDRAGELTWRRSAQALAEGVYRPLLAGRRPGSDRVGGDAAIPQ